MAELDQDVQSLPHQNVNAEKYHSYIQHHLSSTPSLQERRRSSNTSSVTQRLYLTGGTAPRNPCMSLDQCLCLPVHTCRVLTHSGGATDVPMPHADAVSHCPHA